MIRNKPTQVAFADGDVKVMVGHCMTAEHWITHIWVQAGDAVLAVKKLTPGVDEKPELVFARPAGVSEIVAYEHCNQHGVWASEPFTIPDLGRDPEQEANPPS